ncbi:MAG TPA: hypothetical protein QF710_02220 [Candidatus Nitrosopelagicus sp.]|nr:hypothetical protein [Candidatus Nitrosopelagicus sp.]
MFSILKLIFSNYIYVCLALTVFTVMLIPLLIISEHLFLEPYIIFSIYPESFVNFSLILILSIFAGIVISMNIFRIRQIKKTNKIGISLFGTIIGASAGACSCGPVGFSIITTFGTAGGIATAFLDMYEIPLRIISIGILIVVFFTSLKSLKNECKIKS